MSIPVKFGSGGPAAIMIVTVLVCGQVVPAGGLVPVAVPTGWVEPTLVMVKGQVRALQRGLRVVLLLALHLGHHGGEGAARDEDGDR